MGTKVKGLIRGIKNISSQIFDDEKEQEMQIGQPTDVKHVAHIGCDGPAVESPSWMKGFEASKDSQSGPLDKTGSTVETPEVNWVSEDSSNRKTRNNDSSHRSTRSVETARDVPLLPRSTKNRHLSMDNNSLHSESQGKDSSTKTRHRRRHQRGSSESRRRSQDQNSITGDEDSKSSVKKRSSRRSRKVKEEYSGEGSTRSSTKSIADESDLGSDDI